MNAAPTQAALDRIENQQGRLKVSIYLCSAISLIVFLYLFRKHYLGDYTISEFSGLLQGTIGVMATVITILFLVRGIYGAEKQLVLMSQEARERDQDARERELSQRTERELQKLDRALEGRAALVDKGNVRYEGLDGITAQAQHLLRQCRSYLGALESKESIVKVASNEVPKNVLRHRYVSHLELVFAMAAEADDGTGTNRLVDHVWQSLMLEERALSVTLIACGINVPKPSPEAIASWSIAVEPYLAWDGRSVGVREFLT